MIIVIQRVTQASVAIQHSIYSSINQGLLVLIGIEEADTGDDIEWLAGKLCNLRIFEDEARVMNKSVMEIGGDVLIVSQFTLHASTKKGNRPSYIKAAKPTTAIPLYEQFIETTEGILGKKVQTGQFGADMKIALVNDGPVTIMIDSKNRI
jgi:D-aminoacyl-tRNA deacylase